jgi:hypothetical protein
MFTAQTWSYLLNIVIGFMTLNLGFVGILFGLDAFNTILLNLPVVNLFTRLVVLLRHYVSLPSYVHQKHPPPNQRVRTRNLTSYLTTAVLGAYIHGLMPSIIISLDELLLGQ